MTSDSKRVQLGRSGLFVSPIGLGSSYGVSTTDVERAFHQGINYLYWGSVRRPEFGQAVSHLARNHRESMVVVIQSYSRIASLLRSSLERALRALHIEYADFLLLGWWNRPPPTRLLDAARALQESGKARHLMISCHNRLTFPNYLQSPDYTAVMVRYNAAHTGAEHEVFPYLQSTPETRPGMIAYTATRWGTLLDPRYSLPKEPTPKASDCYRFVLSHPSVNLCLAGPANGLELDEALHALERGPMDEEELAWMRRVGQHVHQLTKSSPLSHRGAVMNTIDRITNAVFR